MYGKKKELIAESIFVFILQLRRLRFGVVWWAGDRLDVPLEAEIAGVVIELPHCLIFLRVRIEVH
jgi:hypothetical protein